MQHLSKSRFVAGYYCPELLWHLSNAKEELPERSEMDIAVMEQGTAVGELARTTFPGGILIPYPEGEQRTRDVLDENNPIYEATFRHDRLLCKVDVLRPTETGWDIIEVKSSTRVKDEHLVDVAFQYHILTQLGIPVDRCYVMHIDAEYVREGDIDVGKLFALTDVSDEIGTYVERIDAEVEELLKVMDGKRPDLGTFHRCENRHCALSAMTPLPEHSVKELYYHNGDEFLDQGILRITDIKEGVGLNSKQRIQWETIQTGKPHVNQKKLSAWLATLQEPVCHLDFETINPAVPLFDGTRPYQHIPFQYSLHIEGATLEHHEFLGDGESDPRPALLEQLIQVLPSSGRVLAHNMSFERRVLTDLGQAYPEHEGWVRDVTSRLADTIVPFRNFWYYHPEQHGSCSIKAILPALTKRSYSEMNIGDGALAQIRYARLGRDISEQERAQIRLDLLEYCGLDTEGMVEILAVLRDAALDA